MTSGAIDSGDWHCLDPGQVQQGSGEGSREGLGDFGAEPGHEVPGKVLQKVP